MPPKSYSELLRARKLRSDRRNVSGRVYPTDDWRKAVGRAVHRVGLRAAVEATGLSAGTLARAISGLSETNAHTVEMLNGFLIEDGDYEDASG